MVAGSQQDAPSDSTPEILRPGLVRRISWSEICPWLLIFRSFGVSMSPTVILLATVGLILTPIGWWLSNLCFIGEDMRNASPRLEAATEQNQAFGDRVEPSADDFQSLEQSIPWNSRGVFVDVYNDFVGPFYNAFALEPTPSTSDSEDSSITLFGMRRFAYFTFGAIWMLLVWSFCGGCISRIAVMRLARDERVTLFESIRFTVRHYLSLIGAPLMPFAIVLLFILLMAIPGLIMRVDVGAIVVSVVWGLLLLIGFLIALMILVLSVSWPLMPAAISAESGDGFDAITRSFGYVFQRPLQTVFYATVGVLLMSLGGLLAGVVGESVIHVTRWGASWGAGSDRMIELKPVENTSNGEMLSDGEGDDDQTTMLDVSRSIFGFWDGLVRTTRTGFIYAMFWCISSAVYLVLRRSVDETEIDDVHDDREATYDELPQLEPPPAVNDAAPSPEASEPKPKEESDSPESD